MHRRHHLLRYKSFAVFRFRCSITHLDPGIPLTQLLEARSTQEKVIPEVRKYPKMRVNRVVRNASTRSRDESGSNLDVIITSPIPC